MGSRAQVVAAMIPNLNDVELREFVHVLTHLSTQDNQDLQVLRQTLQNVDFVNLCAIEMQGRLARVPQDEIDRQAQLTNMQQQM